jgi:hypothetical protein
MPMVPQTLVPLADVQEIAAQAPIDVLPNPEPEPEVEGDAGAQDLTEGKSVHPVVIELDAFRSWAAKSKGRKREFRFEFLPDDKGKALNALVRTDVTAARELALVFKSDNPVKAEGLRVGSFVSWGSSGGTARGRIERIVDDGEINVPDSSYTIQGTKDNPAALIRIYRETTDGWQETDRLVGHRVGTLNRIEPLTKAEGFSPPKGVRETAQRALEWVREGRAGGTAVGKKRAADLARGANVSRETIGRMRSFFARHEVDKKATGFNSGEEGFPSPGRVAWDLWGGDAGKSWVDGMWESVKHAHGEGTGFVAGSEEGSATDPDLRSPLERFAWSR